ncbi:cytochrome P450 [Sphingobium sp. HBC34]|uniref:Cytochrome P450 n=1 Tax=Sphingobium cyanobacteriorum TaxID=3063954 RepID=A0ABT8ZIQ0_9SPHN|nr:cytochrome P450 [Sphingobium sp. HBC34]MDO7834409.1 cytochrome P450 [Sphingobium sp. HBC34]
MKIVNPDTAEALADRAAFHNALRDGGHVARVEPAGYYLVGGFRQVRALLEDHATFSKAEGNQFVPTEPHYALNQDPPAFNAFRAIYNAYMSPKGVKRWSSDCGRIANELVDTLLPLGSGDLLPLFGKPLPARVTALALGLPADQIDQYRAWTDAFLSTMIADPAEQARIIGAMYACFDMEFARRRAALAQAGIDTPDPSHVGTILDDNLISVLMTSTIDGRPLTDDEMRRTVRGFFIGGVDTTGALILNTLWRLLERPMLWEQVQSDHSLITAAIEESLRFDPPAFGMFRGVTHDVDIDGNMIPKGSRVLYSTLSANRDPALFDAPDEFRLDRKPVAAGMKNISFGGGAHFCPGAWTARMEARIALEVLIKRLPRLRLTGQVQHYDISNFWVVRHFPAAWD